MVGVPIRFEPDPEIPNADLLGFGTLHYDDGTNRWLDGDAELADIVRQYPDSVDEMGGGLPDLRLATNDDDFVPWKPSPLPGTTEGDRQGVPPPADLMAPTGPSDAELPPDPGMIPDIAAEAAAAREAKARPVAAPPMGPPSTEPIPGLPPASSMSGGGAPPENDGLVLAQREGRLDPTVAARQAEERSAQNIDQQLTLQQGRDDQFAIERRDIREKRLQLRAQMEEQEHQEKIHNQKIARYRDEQRRVADADVTQDIWHAQGPAAVLSIVGAALLGSIGSDAGLRMIDRHIDRHVQSQLKRKDSRLRILADQIGSEEQAANMAKAKYYEAAQKHAAQLERLTQSDVYMAATPGILKDLQSKQLSYEQAAERESLGKSLEKVPTAGKGPDTKMLEKYGKLRRERQATEDFLKGANLALGAQWDPASAQFKNRDALIKGGVQGTGNIESFLPNFLYALGGGVTKEGYRVRNIKEALAFKEARRLNPTGPISNADLDNAKVSAGLDTEEGLVANLESQMRSLASERLHDVKQYGEDVVGAYEGRGVPIKNPESSPGESGTASSEDIAAELLRRKSKPDNDTTLPGSGTVMAGPTKPKLSSAELRPIVNMYADQYDQNPEAIARIIQKESGGDPSKISGTSTSHAGLIQFGKKIWPGVAKAAGQPNVTWEQMRQMTVEEQMPFVLAYYRDKGLGPSSTLGDYYIATALPAFAHDPDGTVVGEKDSDEMMGDVRSGDIWAQNPAWRGKNGKVTVGSIKAFAERD